MGDASVSIAGDAHAPVTTTYIGTQVLGMAMMPLARAAKDPRPVFSAADVGVFTGREWLLDEVTHLSPSIRAATYSLRPRQALVKQRLPHGLSRREDTCRTSLATRVAVLYREPWRTFQLSSSCSSAWMIRHLQGCCRNGPRPPVDLSRFWRRQQIGHVSWNGQLPVVMGVGRGGPVVRWPAVWPAVVVARWSLRSRDISYWQGSGRPDAPFTTVRIAGGRSAQPARYPYLPCQGHSRRRPGGPH